MTAERNIRIANHLIANHLIANRHQTAVSQGPLPTSDCDFFDILCRVTANHNQTLVRR